MRRKIADVFMKRKREGGREETTVKALIEKIRKAQRIVLSTHRESDGDGLGSQFALYRALVKLKKEVRILNVDPMPERYFFLDPHREAQYFERAHSEIKTSDLALIFDTNDERLLEPLFPELKSKCREVYFVDHHPLLKSGPLPTSGSLIDMSAASTGEIVFRMIKELGVEWDETIARALYTSIVFDTQLFRFIRGSSKSHLIAAELLEWETNPEEVHRHIFGNQTIQKIAFLSKALSSIEYHGNGRVAVLKIADRELANHGLSNDASRDLIDMIMNIDSLEVAVLFREDSKDHYKVSFRSKGRIEVLSAAESLGGGGHVYASGAFLKGKYSDIKGRTLDNLLRLVEG